MLEYNLIVESASLSVYGSVFVWTKEGIVARHACGLSSNVGRIEPALGVLVCCFIDSFVIICEALGCVCDCLTVSG